MAAIAWPRARPNVLHPRQYGGINLERAYCVDAPSVKVHCQMDQLQL